MNPSSRSVQQAEIAAVDKQINALLKRWDLMDPQEQVQRGLVGNFHAGGEEVSETEQWKLTLLTRRKMELERLEPTLLFETFPERAENEGILKWWTSEFDNRCEELIDKWGESWQGLILKDHSGPQESTLMDSVPEDAYEEWRNTDPLCKKWAHYNVFMSFVLARAERLGLTERIKPEVKSCSVCGHDFNPCRFDVRYRERFDDAFCGPCLFRAYGEEGDPVMPPEEILIYVRNLTESMQRIPPANLGQKQLSDLPHSIRTATVRVRQNRPSRSCIEHHFGSWFGALVAAGVIDGDAQRMSRGTRCLAEDGHLCHSLGEKTIDDLLHSEGISHEREPLYPETRMRGDFLVGSTIVEYLGLAGNAEYDEKTRKKKRLAKEHGIKLMLIKPEQLANPENLKRRLKRAAQG